MLKEFVLDEAGQTLVEYGLLISLISIVVVTVLTILGQRLSSGFSAATASIATST